MKPQPSPMKPPAEILFKDELDALQAQDRVARPRSQAQDFDIHNSSLSMILIPPNVDKVLFLVDRASISTFKV